MSLRWWLRRGRRICLGIAVPVDNSFLLQEPGEYILLEDGGRIALE